MMSKLPLEVQQMLSWMKYFFIRQGLVLAAIGVLGAFEFASWVPFVVLPLVAAVSSVSVFNNQNFRQRRLMVEYREEVGAVLGKDPQTVTLQDLSAVAYGDPGHGVPGNPVLKHSLNRFALDRNISLISMGAAIAGTFAMIAGGVIAVTGPASTVALGVATFSLAYLGIKTVVDEMLSIATGFYSQQPKDIVRGIRREVAFGVKVKPEQVMELFANVDKGLNESVKQQFGKPYHQLSQHQKTQAVEQFGAEHHIKELTDDINARRIRPGELSFVAAGQSSGVPRKADGEAWKPRRITFFRKVEREVSQPLMNLDGVVNERDLEQWLTPRDRQTSFVERYAPAPAPAGQTHVQRETARRDGAPEAAPSR